MLEEQDRRALLRAARQAIARRFDKKATTPDVPRSLPLARQSGAFATLYVGGKLRGCLGTFEPENNVIDTVRRMAVAASKDDPRFFPLEELELSDLRIELSILSPRFALQPDQVEIGKHGLCVKRGGKRGVLLPQVAVENGWDAQSFLRHTCRKAGLAEDAWLDPETEIEGFTAEVFSER